MLNVIFKYFKSESPCGEILAKHEASGCLPRGTDLAHEILSSSAARTPAQESSPGLWDFRTAK